MKTLNNTSPLILIIVGAVIGILTMLFFLSLIGIGPFTLLSPTATSLPPTLPPTQTPTQTWTPRSTSTATLTPTATAIRAPTQTPLPPTATPTYVLPTATETVMVMLPADIPPIPVSSGCKDNCPTATPGPPEDVADAEKLLQWYYRSQQFLAEQKANLEWGYGLVQTNDAVIQQKMDRGEDVRALRDRVNEFKAELDILQRHIEPYEIALDRHNGYGYNAKQEFVVFDYLEAQNMILTEVLLPLKDDRAKFKELIKWFYSPLPEYD